MSKKTIITIIIIILTLIILTILSFLIDVNRVIEKKEPLFSVRKDVYEDGGTVEYLGFGYKIFRIKNIENDVERVNFGSIFSTYETIVGDEFYD